jgi:hypothetical protein
MASASRESVFGIQTSTARKRIIGQAQPVPRAPAEGGAVRCGILACRCPAAVFSTHYAFFVFDPDGLRIEVFCSGDEWFRRIHSYE